MSLSTRRRPVSKRAVQQSINRIPPLQNQNFRCHKSPPLGVGRKPRVPLPRHRTTPTNQHPITAHHKSLSGA